MVVEGQDYKFPIFFQILRERIYPHKSRDGLIWNSDPGALLTRTGSFSDSLSDFPFKWPTCLASTSPTPGCESLTPKLPASSTSPTSSSSSSPIRHHLTLSSSKASNSSDEKFSAVIFTQTSTPSIQLTAPIFKLVRSVAASKFVQQVGQRNSFFCRTVLLSQTRSNRVGHFVNKEILLQSFTTASS